MLRLFATLPHQIDGSPQNQMEKLTKSYFLDLRDSTLWKDDIETKSLMQVFPERVSNIVYNDSILRGEIHHKWFIIYLPNDSLLINPK
ncbi:MAG: hypothetical protein MUF12_10165 [Sediminibacterium sp.]|nr:hypothetical protein [Sediminibacterium sp.]